MNRKFTILSSIRAKLTLSYLAVILVAMGLSGFLLLSLLDRYFMQATEQSLLAQAQVVAQALIAGAETVESDPNSIPAGNLVQQNVRNYRVQAENVVPLPGDPVSWNNLERASLELSTPLETRIRVLDVNGLVRVDSAGVLRGSDLRTDPLVAEALSGRYARAVDRSGDVAQMHVAVPVMVDGRVVGVVYLSQTLRDVLAVLHDMRLRWWISMGAALLFSGAVGLILSAALARPLRWLTVAAGRVAEGQLDQRVPVRSRDELGQLSEAFNEMTARLKAARQMQTDFVANVSHELRTPLTALKGGIETLRDGAADDPTARDRFLDTLAVETDRLIRLVNDLLLLSRLDSDALTLHKTHIDPRTLIEAAVERLRSQAEARDVHVQIEMPPDAPAIYADFDRLIQVLLNLLDNALKYSPSGGIVTVLYRAEDKSAYIEIRDQGIGIAPEELPRIGERFYRADKARSRAQGGSGLGVAIARALVERHGGVLRLESRLGQGTTATILLPLA